MMPVMGYEISDDERQARSDRAKEMFKQGKFGGPQPGSGRPRTKRSAMERVAERVAQDADDLYHSFADIYKNPEAPASLRMEAAKNALKVESDQRKFELEQAKTFEEMSQKELTETLVEKLVALAIAGTLPDGLFGDVIDAESEEIAGELNA